MRRVLASLMIALTVTGGVPAFAAPAQPAAPTAVPQPGAGEHFLLVQNSKGDIRHGPIWRRNRAGGPDRGFRGYRGRDFGRHHGYRGYRDYGYRRHRHGYGGAVAAGIAGVAAGALIGSALSNRSGNSSCAARFRSYDPRSGTYMGYDGRRHACP